MMEDVGASRGGGDDKFSGETPDVQVAWLLGPIAESGDVGDFVSLVEKYPEVFEDMAVRTVNTPLHVAASMGHLALVKAIMDRRPSLAKKLDRDGLSPLHRAVESEHVLIVKELLLRNRGLCRLRDCHGRTPLHYAVALGKDKVVEALMLIEVAMYRMTDRGETALHLAVKNKRKTTLKILMRQLDKPYKKQVLDQPYKKKQVWQNLISFRPISPIPYKKQVRQKENSREIVHLRSPDLVRSLGVKESMYDKILSNTADMEGKTVIQLAHSNNMYKIIESPELCAEEEVDNDGWVGRLYKFLFKDLISAVSTLHNRWFYGQLYNTLACIGAAAGLYYGGDDEIFMFGKWLLIVCVLTFPLQVLYKCFSWERKPHSQSVQKVTLESDLADEKCRKEGYESSEHSNEEDYESSATQKVTWGSFLVDDKCRKEGYESSEEIYEEGYESSPHGNEEDYESSAQSLQRRSEVPRKRPGKEHAS